MEMLLQEVRFILKLNRNLISLRMLDQASYTSKLEFGRLRVVTTSSLTMMKGVIKNDLYTMVGKTVIGDTSLVQNRNDNKVKLWHLMLGQISQKGLQELENNSLLEKERLRELSFCEDCIFGKTTKVSFKMATHKKKTNLGLYSFKSAGACQSHFTWWSKIFPIYH